MNYVITGGAGNISLPLSQALLAAGHQVTVIGRNPENLASLTAAGARAAIGSVEDTAFLTETFRGADAVYTMIPPNMGAQDWKGYIAGIGKNYETALRESGVKHVVNLSSIGAHMPDGAGPVSGLFYAEQALNNLEGVSILHLRPAYFYTNFFGSLEMIRHMNILGGNIGAADSTLVMVAPADIAAVAADALQRLDFTGHSIRYVVSDERTGAEVASVLGAAVGKPELPWVLFSDEQTLGAMQQAGLPQEIARNYVELGVAMRTGKLSAHYSQHRGESRGNTKLEDFARQFAALYKG
jgi:uncharacterized protein YbjT (DUF2867 family)